MSSTASSATAARALAQLEYPLSMGQRALWFVTRLVPSSPVYNVVGAARFPVAVNPAAFEEAIKQISSRHAVLRTTFLERDGEPLQRVHPVLEPDYGFVDARGWTEERFREFMVAECRRPFDIESGPPVRTRLYCRGERDYVGLTIFHHLVSDLWSIALYVRELDAHYGENAGLRPCRLSEPAAEYEDFVRDERRILSSAEGEELWDYWRRRLSGHLPSLKLPVDHPRPPVQSFDGGMRSLALSPGLTAGLCDLAKSHQTSLSTLCLSAFQAFLHRYCGEEDVIVGFPRANRPRRFSNVFGYFVNPVALRADLSGNPRFTAFLEQNARNVTEDLGRGQFPFASIAERLRVAQDRSQSPVWQVAFTWQKTTRVVQDMARFAAARSGGVLPFESLPMKSVELDAGVSQFDLAVQVGGVDEARLSSGDCLSVTLTYNSDLFRPETAARMLANFGATLESIAGKPESRLSEISILSDAERRQIISGWGRGAVPAADPSGIEDSVALHAVVRPSQASIVCGASALSYSALDERARALAAELRHRGVGPECAVAVCVPRGPEMIVAILAVLKAGGVFVPIDPASPAERFGFILRDASVRLVLAGSVLRPKLDGFEGEVIWLDANSSRTRSHTQWHDFELPSPQQLAYVIYTSGSTGEPKGVGVSRGELVRHCRAMAWHYGLSARDRVLQFASLTFDAALEQIFTALIMGATLFVRPNTLWPPSEFHDLLLENRLTVINLPPAYWHEWLQEWNRKGWRTPEGLRLVIIGGDAISQESVRLWHATAPRSIRLLNAYGPTETTITALTHEISSRDFEQGSRIPIGEPLPQRSAYVLDGAGQPVPFGVCGELYLGGAGSARGYLNRPDLTAERFLPDPYAGASGARLYRTGDQVRWRSDGAAEYMGRLDQQVKIRGFRIELGEIEEALVRHPDVQHAVVALFASQAGNCLCAYVVSDAWHEGLRRELRSFLSRKLPDFMVPSLFVRLDSLPMTSGGKVDRRALPPPGPELFGAGTSEPPRTPLEEGIAAVWKEVLGLEAVGIDDNFFEVGGHSLAATRVLSRLRDEFGIDLPLSAFFENPTVAGLSLALAQASLAGLSAEEAERALSEVEGNA